MGVYPLGSGRRLSLPPLQHRATRLAALEKISMKTMSYATQTHDHRVLYPTVTRACLGDGQGRRVGGAVRVGLVVLVCCFEDGRGAEADEER